MDPNETEVMADQGNWTVEDCILVRVASQVRSFAVLQHSIRGDLVMSLEMVHTFFFLFNNYLKEEEYQVVEIGCTCTEDLYLLLMQFFWLTNIPPFTSRLFSNRTQTMPTLQSPWSSQWEQKPQAPASECL